MNVSSVVAFLASAKASVSIAAKDNLKDTHVVLGNEAADVDSTVCAIVLAYYTAHSLLKEDEKENSVHGLEQTLVFPVINCTREDLPLRTEVIYFLQKHGISIDHLICKDEIDLAGLQAAGQLKLTLVDHNVLGAGDTLLQNSIVQVIDHHKRERPLEDEDIIEPVGSCATLIAEVVLGLFDKDPVICSLLYGTIIYDTVNLSPTAQKATPKDFLMVSELEDCLSKLNGSKPNRLEIYTPLMKARADISQLTPEQLLRKDAKILKTPEISISVPALPLLSQKYLELPNAIEALKASMKATRCSALVVMGWEIQGENSMTRDVTIFSDSIHKAKQVRTPLENCGNLQLELVRHASEPQALIWVYNQKNVTLSRKFMLPFLATHFEKKTQNQIDGDTYFSGVDILMPDGEMSPNKFGLNANNNIPSISYSSAQNLGVGDPISQGGSSQCSSAYNSCPYTPQNSCAEPEDGYPLEHYFLPSFNSREMIEKIEQKRGKLRGYDKMNKDELSPGPCSSYPFTPKNSYVETSNLDSIFEQRAAEANNKSNNNQQQPSGPVLTNNLESEVLLRKLMEKRRNDPYTTSLNYSNSSSKSHSLTKLNLDENYSSNNDTTSRLNNSNSRPTTNPTPTTIAATDSDLAATTETNTPTTTTES